MLLAHARNWTPVLDGESYEGLGGHQLTSSPFKLLRKEVIQPQVPLRLPCYDFTPITDHTFGACFLAVGSATSGTTSFRGVTGGVYKARERIQRSLLICAY